MLFNSIEFAFFFPIVTVLFFLTPHKLRWLLLLLSSCVFYMYFKPEYILILAFIIVVDYLVAIKIEQQTTQRQKKAWLIFSLIANLGVLFIFKYFNFVASNFNDALALFHSTGRIAYINLILPIGLSFHTLQAMSYTIEVSKGKFKAERHFGIYSLYVMFYPQLVAGPIERPQNLIPQFHERKYFNYENARSGMILIAWGLMKKVVIADRLGPFVNQVHSMPDGYYTGIPLIISFIAAPFQIYCDFSGYSDIATGCARIMGYNLMINFKTPVVQPNLNRFWATWHISLTSWFRDYVYIPLRKNLFPKAGMWLSIMVVLVLSGIWHGASWNFVLWGISNALFVIIYNIINKNKHIIAFNSHLSDFWANKIGVICIAASTVFFRSSDLAKAIHIFRDMFKNVFTQIMLIIKNTHGERLEYLYLKQSTGSFFLAVTFLCSLLFMETKFLNRNLDSWLLAKSKRFRWIFYYSMILIFVLFGQFNKLDFIYFQF